MNIMNIKKYLILGNYKKFFKYHFNKKYKISYSQCGEDILMNYVLKMIDIDKPTYIDIGTNHPILNNNTFLFYQRGSRGVCVEPDPELFRIIKKNRKHDINLNIGIGPNNNSSADYYVMSSKSLGTFVQKEANKYVESQNYGKQNIEKIIKIPLSTINDIMEKYFFPCADIVSIDAEGLDFEIIKSLNIKKFRPKIICIESARYNNSGKIEKQKDIFNYLENKDYLIYADTYVNSIFIDKVYINRIH